jgi:GABA permease
MDPRRILVVANQTACGDELLEVVKSRMGAGPCRFTLLVPATPPHEHLIYSEGDAHAIAHRRMDEALARFRAEGAEADGVVGDANPVRAIDDALLDQPHDEIILSTLPPGVSRWLKLDLPHRVEQRFDEVPVTTVISQRQAV